MRPNALIRFATLGAICLLVTSCNRVPIGGLADNLTVSVHTSSAGEDPVKIDFLWVVDNSTSMCEEQIQLAENFEQFGHSAIVPFAPVRTTWV